MKLNTYFSKQTFIDKYREIQVGISYLNQDTKQNSATSQMQKNHKVFSHLLAALTRV